MAGVGVITSLLLLIRFWIWFLNQIFSSLGNDRSSLGKMLLWGGVLVFFLAIYERIFSLLGVEKVFYAIGEFLNLQSISVFILYVAFFVLGIIAIFKNVKHKKIWIQFLVSILILLLLGVGGLGFGGSAVIMYYFLAAGAEEFFKFSVSSNKTLVQKKTSPSTLLLYALLIGFSFSIAENLFFLIQYALQERQFSAGILFGRGFVASFIHLVSTSLIALLMMKLKNKSLVIRYFIALFVGFLFHGVYNIALASGQGWVGVLFAIIGFFALTYILFHMDEIYE